MEFDNKMHLIYFITIIFMFFAGSIAGVIIGYNLKECQTCTACIPCEECPEPQLVENKTVMKYTHTYEHCTLGECINLIDAHIKEARHIQTASEVWSE